MKIKHNDLFSVSIISKNGGFIDMWFNQQYKAEDIGVTIDEDNYINIEKIEIHFYSDNVDLKRALRAILDEFYVRTHN